MKTNFLLQYRRGGGNPHLPLALRQCGSGIVGDLAAQRVSTECLSTGAFILLANHIYSHRKPHILYIFPTMLDEELGEVEVTAEDHDGEVQEHVPDVSVQF